MKNSKIAWFENDLKQGVAGCDFSATKGQRIVVLKTYFWNGEGWVKFSFENSLDTNIYEVPSVFVTDAKMEAWKLKNLPK